MSVFTIYLCIVLGSAGSFCLGNKSAVKTIPFRCLVLHFSASSGQELSFMARVRSMEYSFLFLVIFKVTAGPSDFTSTKLKIGKWRAY